jgi:hypothetical protein
MLLQRFQLLSVIIHASKPNWNKNANQLISGIIHALCAIISTAPCFQSDFLELHPHSILHSSP